MDIRHLEYFTEVAKHLNFTKAASSLHISQPSLSKTVKNMEDELGVPLFNRSFRHLELTDAGYALLHNAKHVLQAYQNLTNELNDVMNLKKGEIRIGIPPIIGAAFCSSLISHYKELYPSINIVLTEVGTNTIKEGIHDGSLDVGFVCNNIGNMQKYDMLDLLHDPLMVIVHENHPLKNYDSITIQDIKDEPFIMYRQDFSLYDRIIATCQAHAFYPQIVCESSQKDFMIEMVEATLGVALLPSQICEQIANKRVKTIPFEQPEIFLELGMIWKKNAYLPYAVREFIEVAKENEGNE